jgi:hypothetical protein
MTFRALFVLLLILSSQVAWASPTVESNETSLQKDKYTALLEKKERIEFELTENNIWSKIYSNYHTYQELKTQKILLSQKIKNLEKKRKLTIKQIEEVEEKKRLLETLNGKLQLLGEYEQDPFKKFLTPPIIEDVPQIESPFSIISALSYREKISSNQDEYHSRYISLEHIMKKFQILEGIIKQLLNNDSFNTSYQDALKDTQSQIQTFAPVIDIFKTTENVYSKKIDEIELNLKIDVQREIERTMVIGSIVIFFIFLLLLIKYLVKR